MSEKLLQVGDKLTLFLSNSEEELFTESVLTEVYYRDGEIQVMTSDGTIFVFATQHKWPQNGVEEDVDFYS